MPRISAKAKTRAKRPVSGRGAVRKTPRKSARKKPRRTQSDLSRARAEAEAAVAEAQRAHTRLREAIDLLPEGVVFIDAEGRYILWNKKYAEIYKGSADLFKPGIKLEDTLRIGVARGDYPEAIGREDEWIRERLEKLYQGGVRHEQQLADGRVVMIEEQQTSDGGVIGLRVDVTEMKRREASFRLLFDGNPVPMLVSAFDDDSILAVNEAALAHYGYDRAAFLTKTIRDLQAFDADAPWSRGRDDELARTWKHVRADGSLIDVAIYSRRLDHDGRPAVLAAMIDITERKRAEARITYLAEHHDLTGLANRQIMRRRGDELLSQARHQSRSVVALCLDIDDFRSVNETYGHGFGDKVLRCVALRLQSSLRAESLVSRIGADQFAIMDSGIERGEDAAAMVRRLLSAVSQPYLVDGQSVTIGACVGIAIGPQDGINCDALLKSADLALIGAKGEGRGSFAFFEAGMEALSQARRRLEADLRTAMEANALEPHYQPLIDIATGDVSGYETLVRWRHPERGIVPPSDFIPVAEEVGLIGSLGTTILHRACVDAASWPIAARVAVNLSPLQFRTGNLLATVMSALKSSGLPPSRLELEITETLLLDRNEQVSATLHALRALGVRICMDDFGTGYSSLSYLRSFPFDKIKIDRSFVRDLDANRDALAIVRAIISLGNGLGVTVTAEGVETEAELACLRAEGCHEVQGFLFAKARPNGEIVAAMTPRLIA